jgi:hypothetical protein
VNWTWALLAPLGVQAAAMLCDELYFHRKRGLGLWERVGHPLDTLTMLACIGWALLTTPTPRTMACYAIFAVLSCAVITKDEFVHTRRCSGGEHWLHAVLFVVHPLSLASVGAVWLARDRWGGGLPDWFGGSMIRAPLAPLPFASQLLPGQFALTAAFCLYQALYWNLPWMRRPPSR